MRCVVYFLLLYITVFAAGTAAQSTGSSGQPHGAYDPHWTLSPSQHVKVALQHKREGRMSLAIDTLTQALVSHGGDKQLLAVRSSLYLESQQPAAALKDLNAAMELDDGDPRLYINRAEVYRQFGRAENALTDLDAAIALDPNMVPAYFNRGTLHFQNGEYQKSLADFTRCINIDPHIAGPYFNRAAVQDALGDHDAAVTDIKRFMELTDNEGWRRQAEELLRNWQATVSVPQQNSNDGS